MDIFFEEYSKAAEILRREKECSVSVELSIREFSYNAKEHCLVIEDFYFSGVTILGKTPDGDDVKPGMAGSNIKLVDFHAENNSLFEENMIEIQRKLDDIISRFNIEIFQKGGGSMNHFEELLDKYNKTVDDIDFEYENLSDEELDAKFAELFNESEDNEIEVEENESVVEEENITDEEDATCVSEEFEASDDEESTDNDVFTRTYELSHDDIRCALYNLLIPYEEADGTYYYISYVYDDKFVYESWCNGGTIYGQGYTKGEETVSFVGERYELFRELLTASEKSELESLRSNYEAMSEKLKVYEDKELETRKTELLQSKDYASIKDHEEFIALVGNNSEMTFEELQEKCDKILLSVAKSGNFSLTSIETENEDVIKPVSVKHFSKPNSKKTAKPSRYGNLFPKENE